MIKLLCLLLFVSCSHSHREKSTSFYLKELNDYEKRFAEEIREIPKNYPELYRSQKLINDSVVTEVYSSLGLNNLPNVYLGDFGKKRISLALFNGKDIYINKEYWPEIPLSAKKMIILHELGHWVGMGHVEDELCMPASISVMCGTTPDYNLGNINEYLPEFLDNFYYLLMIKERNKF